MTLIKRQLQQVIMSQMFKGKTIVLVGARQVGKSTLYKQIVETPELADFKDFTLHLNCDDPAHKELLTNINTEELRMLIGNNRIVVIDEAQRIAGIGITLKLIHDNFPHVQLMVTGSSSFLLHGNLNEPLTGRKFEYNLFPFSTQELYANGGLVKVKQMLESRLIFGSYPDVTNHTDDARDILINLSGSYLYQDLLSLESVRKPVLLEKLLIALALQVGSEVSYNELAGTVGSDAKTVEKYVDLLEKCYIIFRLSALSRNVRTELKKSKKIYFYDNGIRNAIIQNFNPLHLRNDVGALWENFFISERLKYNHYNRRHMNIYFWRTTNQQEIDYIEESDGTFTAFELKWNPRRATTVLPADFTNNYPIADTAVITPDNYLKWVL